MSELPDDYGTPEYEQRWVRRKLGLSEDAPVSYVQGLLHVRHARGRDLELLKSDLARVTAERDALQSCLVFYAEPENYYPALDRDGEELSSVSDIANDEGERARNALEATP